MRIAMISEHANPLAVLGEVDAGGQNLHVAELSAALAADGHEVTVYSRCDDRDTPTRVTTPQGYEVVHVPAGPARHVPKDELLPHMGDFTHYLRERWQDSPPDVVHSHFWMSGMAAVFATRGQGVPVVHTYHALGTVKRRHLKQADPSPPSRLATERLIGKFASRVVATCTDEVRELGRMGVPASKVSVVPCGVDCDQFQTDGEAAAKGLPRRVVSVGRLVPRKGFGELIAAIARQHDTELVIVGGPAADRLDTDPEALRLRALADRLGVADRVHLVGQQPRARMPALLRSADVVACVPRYEPFGIVPLEAMACGRPVLATAVGGLVDTVVDGVTGVLVSPGRPDELARTLRALLADPVQQSFLGTAGRDRAESRYPWRRIGAETVRAYESCVDTGASLLRARAGSAG